MSSNKQALPRALQRSPSGLPVLARGAHRSTEHGACLMEYVSVLAGSRFSDRPPCTHPALAQLARWVNDQIADSETRSRLAVLAPDLIGTNCRDPRIPLTVMICCLRAALATGPQDSDVAQMLRRAEARLRRLSDPPARRWVRCLTLGWGFGPGSVLYTIQVAMRGSRRLVGQQRDEQLRQLLERAILNCRALLIPHRAAASRLSRSTPPQHQSFHA